MTRFTTDSLRKDLEGANQRILALEKKLAEIGNRTKNPQNDSLSTAQSEAFLLQSAKMAHLGYAIWDDILDKDITVSEELARIHGQTVDEYCDIVSSMGNYLEFVVPTDRNRYMEFENQLTPESDDNDMGIEYCITRSDGQIRHLHQRSQYIPASDGPPTQSIVVIQDISDRIERENDLNEAKVAAEQASIAKSEFLALISHEIRTPLNAVVGALELLDTNKIDSTSRSHLNVGKTGAENLLLIINDILDFSKLDAGKIKLEPVVFNAQKAIDDMLQVLELRARDKNISLSSDMDIDVPEFFTGDVSRIRQVLLNL